MSAIFLGLAGVLLAGGGVAAAKPCKLDGLELVAAARDGGSSPFIGETFKVIRSASTAEGANSFIAVEIEGRGRRFFVDQSYIPHSLPWVSATSWAAGGTGSAVDWSKRDKRVERRLFDDGASFDVYDGPLSGQMLQPVNCR